MPDPILDGLSLVDSTGRVILATTLASLLAGLAAHVFVRAGYAALERDLERNSDGRSPFEHPVLTRIVQQVEAAGQRSNEPNIQAIIEENLQSGIRPLLFAERFIRAATGLVIILGLLGTFYGLTLSIGKLVHLVSGDVSATADVAQSITQGLTQALTGMAVAFSNSLLGIVSAVVLTIVGVFSSVTDRRTALMVRLETYLDRHGRPRLRPSGDAATFSESVARLEQTVARFDGALQRLAESTKDLREVQLVVALRSETKG